MTRDRGPLLLIAGGCAAMLGVAAMTVSFGSFFSDLPTSTANAAAVSGLPVKVVKTISVTAPVPQAVPSGESATAAARTARPSPTPSTGTVAQKDDDEVLHQSDPRWARHDPAGNSGQAIKRRLESAYADDTERALPAGAAAMAELGAGGAPLALLSAAETAPVESLARAVKAQDDEQDEPQRQVAAGRTVSVNDAVNMRAAPRSGSRVILVVPDGAKVSMAAGCKDWCRISYNGRTGYVYRSFVAGGAAAKKSVKRTDTAQQQGEAKPVKASDEPGLFGNSGVFNNSGQSKDSDAVAQATRKKLPVRPLGGELR